MYSSVVGGAAKNSASVGGSIEPGRRKSQDRNTSQTPKPVALYDSIPHATYVMPEVSNECADGEHATSGYGAQTVQYRIDRRSLLT